jgi:propionate CoA-transferase
MMNWLTKIKLILHIIRWRLTWSKYSLDYRPKDADPQKFISAHRAAQVIEDRSCIFSNGIAGNARCSIFFYAIRDRFKKTGHPQDLTWINGGAQGSRGRVPGTIEELALPGLMKTYLSAHIETAKAQLKLGQEGKLALYTLPQGIISLLLNEQGKGKRFLKSKVGWRTFLDPVVGEGAAINKTATAQFVFPDKDGLVYTMPQPDIALFNAPYADGEGNIYFKHAATITENMQSIQAVRQNKGKVMAAVSRIIPKEPENISVPSHLVDFIIVNPYNEQTVSVPQHRYWSLFTPECRTGIHDAIQRLKFINTFLRITPVRTPIGNMVARLAASLFVQIVPNGGTVNIGVGFPEEVARLLVENNLDKAFTFTSESGAFGGLPAPGIFFGAAIHPDRLEPSSTMFERYHRHLDAAILGFLEVDSDGNVNVSNKGPNITDYVGPGGFPDIVHGAKNIIFIGNWMHNAEFEIRNNSVKLVRAGHPKFVERVREITFNGQEALKLGKKVLFVTNIGCFQLTGMGLKLIFLFPGIKVKQDILNNTTAEIYVPSEDRMPLVNPSIISGKDFNPSTTITSLDLPVKFAA